MTFPLQRLENLPVRLGAEAMMGAFEPFMAVDAVNWRSLAWRNRRRALGRLVEGMIGGARARDKAVITGEYEGTWARGYSRYDVAAGCVKPEPWRFRGAPMVADRAGTPRLRHVLLGAVLRHIKPRRVLEVGCGNGINLLLLAGAFPEIAFTGLELTEAGHRMARGLQGEPRLPAPLATYADPPPLDAGGFRRIDFQRGDATRMPFADGAFDLVFTVLAVEQMERVRHAAMTEIARVSGGHVLHLEPFADVNRGLWRRMHVHTRDYFRGEIAALPRYGLEPLWATDDFPQEELLGAAMVLSAKSLRRSA